MLGGIIEAANYFLKKTPSGAYQHSRRKDLSDTVDITSANASAIRRQGWIVDPDDPGRTLYAKAHHYETGDPIRLSSSGKLPSPLQSETPYFVIKNSSHSFQLASTRADALRGNAIILRNLGTGVFEAMVDWTWTLISGQPAATPTQAVQLGDTGTSYEVDEYALGSGLQHFLFTGHLWPAHSTTGIDLDVYLVPDGDQKFYIGTWGHSAHSGRETGEYQRANGAPFRESQQILRVSGNGSFTTIILPYRKGEAPTRTVTHEGCGIRISEGNESLCLSEHGYQFSDGNRTMLTTFDSDPARFAGITLSGGPTEVVRTK